MSKKVKIAEYMLEDIQDLQAMAEQLKHAALDTGDLHCIRSIGFVAQSILDQSGKLEHEVLSDD